MPVNETKAALLIQGDDTMTTEKDEETVCRKLRDDSKRVVFHVSGEICGRYSEPVNWTSED